VDISSGASQDDWYELRLQGHLDPRWSSQLEGMALTQLSDGTTLLRGRVVDQVALHGLLARVRDIGLPVLSLTRVDPRQPHDHINRHDIDRNNPNGD
jgi:hypothetical protein